MLLVTSRNYWENKLFHWSKRSWRNSLLKWLCHTRVFQKSCRLQNSWSVSICIRHSNNGLWAWCLRLMSIWWWFSNNISVLYKCHVQVPCTHNATVSNWVEILRSDWTALDGMGWLGSALHCSVSFNHRNYCYKNRKLAIFQLTFHKRREMPVLIYGHTCTKGFNFLSSVLRWPHKDSDDEAMNGCKWWGAVHEFSPSKSDTSSSN